MKGNWMIKGGEWGDTILNHGRGTQAEFEAAFEKIAGTNNYFIEGSALNDKGGDVVISVCEAEFTGDFILDLA